MKRGEVWWVNFEPSVGSETIKIRPAVIVSSNSANTHLNRVQVEWLSVEFEPEITFEHPVTFEQLKSTDALRELKLFKQPRLSVMPLTDAEYLAIQELSVQSADKIA